MTSITVRVDEDIKRDADELFNKMGLNLSTAINTFLRQALVEQAMPFAPKPYDPNPFYSDVNRGRIKRAIDNLEAGKGVVHELIEVDDE